MSVPRVTILEFAPTADEIWCIPKHDKDGYVSYDPENGLVSILDTAHEAKPRPEIITTYAGGKATNVARVLDRLLTDEDKVYVELVTFLPPPPEGPLQNLRFVNLQGIPLHPSTAAGIYIQCLQIAAMRRVKLHFEIVPELAESHGMQTTRRCIEITLKEDKGTLNFSPRIVWSQKAAEAVISRVAEVTRNSDFVVMAGATPVWEVNPDNNLTHTIFYSSIIDRLDQGCKVSIDTRGKYLYDCLKLRNPPRFIFMNVEEFTELAELMTESNSIAFPGTLIIHNKQGCWIWDGKLPDRKDSFTNTRYFQSIPVDSDRIYSTIGAGDAMHAGFLKRWICARSGEHYAGGGADERLRLSIIYSQVVAAASISNEKATHGIDIRTVEEIFRLWH